MDESPPPPTIALHKALVAALGKLTVVGTHQEADAGSYRYKYADIADLVALTRPVLADNGLVALTPVHAYNGGLACTVMILHESGERLGFDPLPFPQGRDAQATGSMITYHRRYALLAALGMATGDDDDDGAGAQQAEPEEVVVVASKKDRDRIIAILNEIPADATVEVEGGVKVKARQAAKVDYLNTFGISSPARLPADKVSDALEWAAGRLAVHAAFVELDSESALKGIRAFEERLTETTWPVYTAWLTETFSEPNLEVMDAGDLEQIWRRLQELVTVGPPG